MKHIKSIAAMAALGAASAAQSCTLPYPLELGYLGAATADMLTTLDIRHRPGMYETNPILGRHPSDARVIGYFLATDALHVGATCLMVNAGLNRTVTAWELGSIAFEATYAAHNFSIGLRFHF